MMIKVFIVDDHPLFRSGAATTIGEEPDMEIVGEAEDAEGTMDAIHRLRPDVILMDIRLTGNVNGLELARRVRMEAQDIKIVILTNFSNEPYIRAMMEIGVEGYILKDTPPDEVIGAVRMVLDGRTVFSDKVTRTVVNGFLDNRTGSDLAPLGRITEREAEILRLLADGVSNADIAAPLNVAVGTVQYHLTNIYGKLGVRGRTEAIIKAVRLGLVVVEG